MAELTIGLGHLPQGGVVETTAKASAGPWRTAFGQLRRNRGAMASAVVLVIVVLACLLAPVYAGTVAHTDPFASNVSGTTVLNGRTVPVLRPSTTGLGLGVTPIGPTGDTRHFFLGADNQGRDVMARLLYGGRNSLLIGFAAALLCCALATLLGVLAGYFGGYVDAVLARLLDVVWAFPVYLLAICLFLIFYTVGSTFLYFQQADIVGREFLTREARTVGGNRRATLATCSERSPDLENPSTSMRVSTDLQRARGATVNGVRQRLPADRERGTG